jgi:hypothetical protein
MTSGRPRKKIAWPHVDVLIDALSTRVDAGALVAGVALLGKLIVAGASEAHEAQHGDLKHALSGY